MKQRLLRLLLSVVGKLGGSINTALTPYGHQERLIFRLEAEIVELRSERSFYRDEFLKHQDWTKPEPEPVPNTVDPSEFYKGTMPVRNWRTAKRILTRAALLKKERKEQPIHIGAES